MRLFVGIHFPEDIVDQITALQGELRRKINGGRFPGRENIHLTLQFLGETSPRRIAAITTALTAAARAHRSFTLSLGQPGYFGKGNPVRVVWLGISGELTALRRLQGGVASAMHALGFKEAGRPYAPHITLLREADFIHNEDLPWQGRIRIDTGKTAFFPVETFSLIASTVENGRRIYRDLATFELGLPK